MRLPIGVSDFRELIEHKDSAGQHYVFADKTSFIKDIMDVNAKILVVTRPSRFGKTLNLSMLKYFFAAEVNGQPTAHLFKDLKISTDKKFMKEYQGKYPVVYLSFKDIKQNSYDSAINKIRETIRELYTKHHYLINSDKLLASQKDLFNSILQATSSIEALENSLYNLTKFIYLHSGQRPILLIDEYDTPIQQAYLKKYEEPLVGFMRNLFGASLKDNQNITKAVIAGITMLAKESVFSGVNNVQFYTVLDDDKFSSYFGFMEHEVSELFSKAKVNYDMNQIKGFHNGYRINGDGLCNPSSIIKCIDKQGKVAPYWTNASCNDLIKALLQKATSEIKVKLETLFNGGQIEEVINENIVFNNLNAREVNIWSLLLTAGYLKQENQVVDANGVQKCKLKIPNMEAKGLLNLAMELSLEEVVA